MHDAPSPRPPALPGQAEIEDCVRGIHQGMTEEGRQSPQGLFLLGMTCLAAGLHERASLFFSDCLGMDPAHARAKLGLGKSLQAMGRLGEAFASYVSALELEPTLPEAYFLLGTLQHAWGKLDEALHFYEKALELAPNNSAVRFHRSQIHLLRGDFTRGWEEYEERWDENPRMPKLHFSQPLWLGDTALEGRSLLLHAEQGLGDTLFFAAFLPTLAQLGAPLCLQVQPTLVSLLADSGLASKVISSSEQPPVTDLRCPLGSLPLALLRSKLSHAPKLRHLQADKSKTAYWQERLGPRKQPRVGFVWKGNAKHPRDTERSVPLESFQGLFEGLPLELVSLQKQNLDEGMPREFTGPGIFDPSDELTDFSDTAALVEALDLVITVDTSVAHLAAGLGKPTWILLTWIPDWRWGLGGEACTWYPSARLFRQPRLGDWNPVFSELRHSLETFCAQGT